MQKIFPGVQTRFNSHTILCQLMLSKRRGVLFCLTKMAEHEISIVIYLNQIGDAIQHQLLKSSNFIPKVMP